MSSTQEPKAPSRLEGKGSPYAKRLGEYAGAAIQDMTRYRTALWEIEQILSPVYEVESEDAPVVFDVGDLERRVWDSLLIAGKALRQYDPNAKGGAG